MAGDWLKVEANTPDKPEVIGIADMLGIQPTQAFGCLFMVWRWFDQHTTEGNAAFVTKVTVDRLAGVTGFADAMVRVGWLEVADDGSITLPNFGRHNGETAKQRGLTAKRVAAHKAKKAPESNELGNGEVTDDALPREEKRREEVNQKQPAAASEPSPPVEPDEAPPPTSAEAERAKALAARFDKLEAGRGHQKRTAPSHPSVIAWVRTGVTDPEFREAFELAAFRRQQAEDPSPINPKYLLSFIQEVVQQAKGGGTQPAVVREWFMSWPLIEKKAEELGIQKREGEVPVYFRDRVYAAAGVTPDMIRKAEIDSGRRPSA